MFHLVYEWNADFAAIILSLRKYFKDASMGRPRDMFVYFVRAFLARAVFSDLHGVEVCSYSLFSLNALRAGAFAQDFFALPMIGVAPEPGAPEPYASGERKKVTLLCGVERGNDLAQRSIALSEQTLVLLDKSGSALTRLWARASTLPWHLRTSHCRVIAQA